MLTNLVRDLDDHDLSILHSQNTQNGLVGVACVNPLQKQISHPGSAAGRLRQAALVGSAREPRVRINSARIWPRAAVRQISVVFNIFRLLHPKSHHIIVAPCARVVIYVQGYSKTLANQKA